MGVIILGAGKVMVEAGQNEHRYKETCCEKFKFKCDERKCFDIMQEESELKTAAVYMHFPTEYGHVYQDCLAFLCNTDVIFPQYDSVLVQMTPILQAVIDFFGLTFSNKLKFVFVEHSNQHIPEFTKEITINRFNKRYSHGGLQKTWRTKYALLALKNEFQRLKPIVNTPKQYLIFCSRNNSTGIINNGRCMKQQNEDEIVAYLKEYANKHNLEFHLLTGQEPDGSRTSISKQHELFTNAKIVIGPHGAAFANIIHLDPAKEATVIEFCPKAEQNRSFQELFHGAVDSFAAYHKIEYGPNPANPMSKPHHKRDLPHIDITKIKLILE